MLAALLKSLPLSDWLFGPAIQAQVPTRAVAEGSSVVFSEGRYRKPSKIFNVSRDINGFAFDVSLFEKSGLRMGIFAQSGFGKSYLTRVLIEETLENNGVTIVIDPEGEWHSLSSRYPMLIVGGDKATVELGIDPETVGVIGNEEVYGTEEKPGLLPVVEGIIEAVLQDRVSVVFDLSDFEDSNQQAIYAVIANTLFQKEKGKKKRVFFVVDEAAIYAPEGMTSVSKIDRIHSSGKESDKLAKRGRKRAINQLWVTQRIAQFAKMLLSQFTVLWFGGISAEADYKAIKEYILASNLTFQHLKLLQPGQFYCVINGRAHFVNVRESYTEHIGSTPEDDSDLPAPTIQTVNSVTRRLKRA
jgi:hypothetical protein